MLRKIAPAMILTGVLGFPCSMVFSKGGYRKERRSDTPLFRFEKKGRAGYIDAAGKIVIPTKFDIGWFSEEDFVEGLSPARVGENWGFIDLTGKWVYPAAVLASSGFLRGARSRDPSTQRR